tara:strand:+ start:1416 stop:2384 length:969 start_codon:yes stop_codon:yes gene_type:complete
MLSVLIIETVPRSKNPIDAHVRNAISLKNELINLGLKVDLLFSEEKSTFNQKKYDVILISYASPYPDIKGLDKIFSYNKNSVWGWLINEYNIAPNGFAWKIFSKCKSFLLANYDVGVKKYKCFDKAFTENLNLLLYKEFRPIEKKYNFIYYGTYRTGREKYFKKYLQLPVYLSTSTKNHKKFKHIGCTAKPITKFSWQSPALNKFRYSLYFEDEFTHDNFNNLANRFYESLGSNCVILFDKNCENTLKRSGLKNYKDYIIENVRDLDKYNANNYKKFLLEQSIWKSEIVKQKNKMIKNVADTLTLISENSGENFPSIKEAVQ